MNIFNFFRSSKNDYYSQSGQDQFAHNLLGYNNFYLEIGAHHPIINSNTYNLETKCGWSGLSIEYDISFKSEWDEYEKRNNEIIWDDAFNIDYSKIAKEKNFPKIIGYLSCDIEPPKNTFNILKKIINSNLVFKFISFEHDKYNIGDKYEKLSEEFLLNKGYKIAIPNVYSRNKKNKIYETWYIKNDIEFDKIDFSQWKKNFYSKNKFIKNKN